MPPRTPRKCLTLKPPKFQLLGASDCENPSAISKKQILAWQEHGIIEYLGSTKDVRPFLESASCVVLPSSYKEGVPRVLLEAMSMGKAIITTNIAGCRECVAPPLMPYENLLIGQNGILIPPKDAQALSLAISLLLSNELPHTHNALMQMGANARAFVKGRFDIARIVECYKKAVRENSASGNHSPDCLHFRAVITDKVTPTLKCKQNKQSNTAKQATAVQGEAAAGFFRNLRILEEESQAGCENTPTPSSRDLRQQVVAICAESTFQNKDSRNAFFTSAESMDCHADKSARNDRKTQNLNESAKDSRSFNKNAQNLSKPQAEAKLDSSKSPCDSKILELESGLFEPRAEIRLGGLSHKRGDEIHNPSPKAESHAKLVFVSNTCFGMYNFRLQVLQSLQKSGFTIHIIAPFDSSTQALEQEGFITHNLYLDSRSLNPLKDFRTITMLHKLLKRIRPALVFNYTIKPAIYSSSVCNFLKIPNIALITGLGYVFINDRGKTSSLKKRVLRSIVCKMYRFALSKTQEVWFLNNDDKQEFLFYKLIRQNQAFLLDSEGVDTEYFSPKNSVKVQKQEKIVFLLVARMLWDKGVGEFVEAAKMVQDSIKEANEVESNGGGA